MKAKQQPELTKLEALLNKYAESHQNATNKYIHWLCVPLIVLSILGLLTAIPFPQLSFLGVYQSYINWVTVVLALVGYYYYRLSPILMWVTIIFLFGLYFLVIQLEHWAAAGGLALWQSSLIIFILAWIGQFIGHHIEGKKPSFLQDIQFLLIGPLWIIGTICRFVGIKYT